MASRRKQTSPTSAERLREATRQRREDEKRELRQTILDAAATLFFEQGYEGFSLRQLAERIGYAPATIYLYFQDKDDLLFTLVNDGFAEFGRRLQAAAARTSDPRQRLVALGRAYVEFGLTYPMHYRLMFVHRPAFLTGHAPDEPKPHLDTFQVLQDAVQAAMAAGVMRRGDLQSTSDALWALTHGIVTFAIFLPFFDPERVQALIEKAAELVEDALPVR